MRVVQTVEMVGHDVLVLRNLGIFEQFRCSTSLRSYGEGNVILLVFRLDMQGINTAGNPFGYGPIQRLLPARIIKIIVMEVNRSILRRCVRPNYLTAIPRMPYDRTRRAINSPAMITISGNVSDL